MKNWQTTAGSVLALAIAICKLYGIEIPDVSHAVMDFVQAAGVSLALFRAKDKGVTGAGGSAVRIEQ